MERESGIQLSERERERLQDVLKQACDKATLLRSTVVLLSGSGQSSEQIARALGLSPRMVRDCRQRWRMSGVEGLSDLPRVGRPKRADARYVRLLIHTVRRDPRELGYAFCRWTTPRLAAYLAQETGVTVSPDWVGELLRMHRFAWGKSKRTTRNLPDAVEKKEARGT
jgi:transposase